MVDFMGALIIEARWNLWGGRASALDDRLIASSRSAADIDMSTISSLVSTAVQVRARLSAAEVCAYT